MTKPNLVHQAQQENKMVEEENEQETECDIHIYLDKKLDMKLKYLSSEFPKEVGGWLVGEFKDDGIYIEDLLMPEQEVSGSSVDINPSAGPKLMKEYKDKCKKIIGHWHSHVSMGCFWSATDETNMAGIMEPREKYVFIVSSKGEHLIRIETKVPFRMSINKIGYEVIDEEYDKIGVKMDKELKKKIIEPAVSTTIPYANSYAPKNDARNWFNRDAPIFEEEVVVGVLASYEKKELTISGLAKDEKDFLLEAYKSRRAECVYPIVNGKCDIMIKVSGYGQGQKLVQDIRETIAQFGIDGIECIDEFSTQKDLEEAEKLLGDGR